MPGAKPLIADEVLIDLITTNPNKFTIVDEHGQVLPPSAKVWENICEALNKMSLRSLPKTLYLRFKHDRKKILSKVSTVLSHFPNSSVESSKKVAAEEEADSICELLDLENDSYLRPIFKCICDHPSFYVNYRWLEQIDIWKTLYKVNRSMVFQETNIKKKAVYVNINNEHREIGFYSLLSFFETTIVPVFHTIVDRDYAKKLAFYKNFFSQWLEEKLVPPRELVVLPNITIIEASVCSFNHQTTSEYNNCCFGFIFGRNLLLDTPSCIL